MSDELNFTMDDIAKSAEKLQQNSGQTPNQTVEPTQQNQPPASNYPNGLNFSPADVGITPDQLLTKPVTTGPMSYVTEPARAAWSGAAQGITPLTGVKGSVGYGVSHGIDYLREKFLGTPESKIEEERYQQTKDLPRAERFSVDQGYAIPDVSLFGAPTTTKTMAGAEKWGKENIPGYEYKTDDPTLKAIQTGFNFGAQSLFGAPEGMAARFATGLAAGAGAETVGSVAENFAGPWGKLVGDVGGAVLSDFLGRRILEFGKNMAFRTPEAYQKLAEAAAKDFASNPEELRKIKAALDAGEPIQISDFLKGPNAKSYLNSVYNDKQQAFLEDFSQKLADRNKGIDKNVNDFYKSMFGKDMREENFSISKREANKTEMDRIYTKLKNLPHADAVWTPELARLVTSNSKIEAAYKKVLSQVDDMPAEWNVIGGSHPNLAFWDQVKRQLDANIKGGSGIGATGEAISDVPIYQNAKNKLIAELDKAVPEYPGVRNKASEMFGGVDALEGGLKMARQLASGSPIKRAEFMKNFDLMSPDQKEMFATGIGRHLLQLSKGDFKSVINYMENPEVSAVLKKVLGEDRFYSIYGKSLSSNLMATANGYALTAQGKKIPLSEVTKEGLKIAGSAAPGAVASLSVGALFGGGLTAAGVLGHLVLNSAEKKVGQRALQLAFSDKPEDAARLGELISKNYDALSVLQKTNAYLDGAKRAAVLAALKSAKDFGQTPGVDTLAPDQIPTGQANGGRIQRKAGGRIKNGPEALSREVMQIRKELSHHTSNMLSMPDDAIVTALKIAKH